MGDMGQIERPWLWKKGQSGNPSGKRSGSGARRAPALLRAMRFVARRGETSDKTVLHKECRAWLKENRKSFMTKWADLEKAYLVSFGKAKEPQSAKAPQPIASFPRPGIPPKKWCPRCMRQGLSVPGCPHCKALQEANAQAAKTQPAEPALARRPMCDRCYRFGHRTPGCPECQALKEAANAQPAQTHPVTGPALYP